MALSVRKTVLWRKEIQNHPGTLADSLKPFAKDNVNLQVVMGYVNHQGGSAIVEVCPIVDGKAQQAAKEAGMHADHKVATLILEGEDRAGLIHDIAQALGSAGVNMHFAMFQSIGSKYQGIIGFGSEADADKAQSVITKALQK